ncbi:Rhodanese-like domain-containing protein [Xylariaceae sp. FL0594]|nr:Rhodanese-like domain-containing protein [Xylariaceae sp. FL0594]
MLLGARGGLAATALVGLARAVMHPVPAALCIKDTTTPSVCADFTALVSPSWLDTCQSRTDLAVIDLRPAEQYAESHIPGSFSVPFGPVSAWSETSADGLLLEMPPPADILAVLASVGASSNNQKKDRFVLVNGVGVPAFPQADSPRVAATLKYAGVPTDRVAILDGGFPAWTSKNLPTTTTVTVSTAAAAVTALTTARENHSFLVNRTYVAAHLDKKDQGIFLFDGRDANVYDGSVTEPWSANAKRGHIPSAVSMPAEHIWNADGSYKTPAELLRQLDEAVGPGVVVRQFIVYCGVGGYASSLYFVLTRILGFENVVMYDGSAQEWSRYHDFEL